MKVFNSVQLQDVGLQFQHIMTPLDVFQLAQIQES